MSPTSFYPVLMTTQVSETASFYRCHFGFEALFSSDWYVHLQMPGRADVNIAVLDARHETIPAPARGRTAAGLLINFEVDDVDAQYERLRGAGLPIRLALRDEDFGQRHFITEDPNGVLIDVITPIAPQGDYVDQYEPGARPADPRPAS